MKWLILPSLLFCTFWSLYSQGNYYLGFNPAISKPCPFDSTTTVNLPEEVILFQTLDNTPFGLIDSTICPSIINNSFIDFSSIEPRNLYLEIKSPRLSNFPLLGNDELILFFGAQSFQVEPRSSYNCYVEVAHELIEEDGSTSTIYPSRTDESGNINCMLIENFTNASIKRIIIEIEIVDFVIDVSTLRIWDIFLEKSWAQQEINSIVFLPRHKTEEGYSANASEIINQGVNPWEGSYFIKHPDIQQARAGIIHYFDVEAPEEEKAGFLDIIFDEYFEVLQTQPYTTIRSDFINPGSDIRHTVRIIQDSDMCIPTFIDFVVDENIWWYKSGYINFEHLTSCILFKNKASLFIEDQTIFEYGNDEGVGMMGLRGGISIVLGKQSGLHIGNTLALIEDEIDKSSASIHLKRGQSLSFGANSSIVDMNSALGNLVLDVYMEGGSLDISHLDEQSKRHLNLIYPERQADPTGNYKVYADYSSGQYAIAALLQEGLPSKLDIYDIQGQKLQSKLWTAGPGWSEYHVDLSEHPSGIYLFTIYNSKEKFTGKLLKP